MPLALRDKGAALTQRITVGDLSTHGLPLATIGVYARNLLQETNPVLDHGVVAAIRSGRVTPVAAVAAVDGPRILLTDGTYVAPDVLITATGYRPALENLVGALPLVQPSGLPRVRGAQDSPFAPGLYFIGYSNPLSGALHQAGVEARQVARLIARHRKTPIPRPRQPKVTPDD